MLASIRKFSKSFVAKIFIAIIALPFIMWGMGDVFTSGKQNILVEINDQKINSKDFVTHLQKINLTREQVDSIGKSKLLDDILTNYISEKIIDIEREKKGIELNDNALMRIIVSDKTFQKDNKFSRTKYEKFLLQNNYNAPTYERYLKGIELKAQLLNYYSGGISLPEFVIDELYKKENQIKEIEFIDLNKVYAKKIIEEKDIEEFYKKNEGFFEEKFISFRYFKLLPENLTEKKDFDEEYYKKLDEVENSILDGEKFDSILQGNKNNIIKIELVNSRKIYKDGTKIKEIDDLLFEKIFDIKEKNLPQFISINNKFYVAELLDEKKINLTLKDKDLRNTIQSQLKIQFKIKENKKLIEKINKNKFNQSDMSVLSMNNNVLINKINVNGINDKKKFTHELVKQIYDYNTGEFFLLSDGLLQEIFLVRILKEIDPKIEKKSENYKKYVKKANAEYISKIYKSYDKYINANYEIEINQKVLERLKNSF